MTDDDEIHIELIAPQPPEPAGTKVYPWGMQRIEYMTREEFEAKYPPHHHVEVGKPLDGVIEFYNPDGSKVSYPLVGGADAGEECGL